MTARQRHPSGLSMATATPAPLAPSSTKRSPRSDQIALLPADASPPEGEDAAGG